jgi:hypothetical protein
LVFHLFQTHADILFVQWTEHRVLLVIELFRHEDTLIASEGHRLWEVRVIDIVDGSPGTVYPMCTRLQDVMLEIMLVIEEDMLTCCLMGKIIQTAPVLAVGFG